jgi:hypothetical protein
MQPGARILYLRFRATTNVEVSDPNQRTVTGAAKCKDSKRAMPTKTDK